MRRWFTVAAFALGLAPSTALAVDYASDPLTADTFTGRGSKGGSFGANGWTVQNESDAVWYEIPEALPSGRVEYTVTGLSLQSSLTGVDHDIFTMYQAPTGQAEPIAYSPYFRNNDFKVFTRIFGINEPGRAGAMKLELAFCPRGDPWYHDDPCTAACDGSGIAYANGSQNDLGWDPTVSYRMAVEWGNGQVTFYRDQAALGSVPYPGEWSPDPLRVRLGSPRHDGVYPGAAFMPIGITIKDVSITGTPGAMTPVCGATTPTDAGAPDASPPADAGATTSTFDVLADVTAASWESGVFPDVTDLNVEADASGAPTGVVYLRFPALTGSVKKAVLRLHAQTYASAAGGSGIPCAVADDTWSETTLTWATRPPVGSTCAGKSQSVDPGLDTEWDVTPLVTSGKNVNLAIVSADTNGAHFMSRENGDPALGPKLTVELEPTTDSGAGGSGSGGWGNAGGALDGGLLDGGGGKSEKGGASGASDSGCGCRTTGAPSSALGGGALVALALALGRRRKSRRA